MILSTTLNPDLSTNDAVFNHLSVDTTSASLVSMQEFDGQAESEPAVCAVDGGLDSPPSYEADALLQKSQSRRKFNIQPREDEGRETLPPYSSEISLENVFMRKMELDGAVHKAHNRNWYPVHVTLQGTALTFHKAKSQRFFSGWLPESGRTDEAVPGMKGPFSKSYNLQHADVGIAADYYKKRFVIRVRAETDQFLLSCFKMETLVHWLQSLFAAIDIAPPLDVRSLPRDLSIPRFRRRRVTDSTLFTNIERNAQLVREQVEIMRRQYPGLVDSTMTEGTSTLNSVTAEQIERRPTTRTRSAPQATSTNDFSSSGSSFSHDRSSSTLPQPPTLSHHPSASSSTSEDTFRSSINGDIHPSISPETGKWRPEHHPSAAYDVNYARCCMAILTRRSPRKSDFVIMKGKQWAVDWVTGVLTRCEPPDYGECVVVRGLT